MTREQYFNLRSELISMARKIKETKPAYRLSQRNLSLYQNKNGSLNDYYEGRINSTKWEFIRAEHEKLYNARAKLHNELVSTQDDFRLKHMVYCFARGKTRQQIEPKVRQGNQPNEYRLEKLMKEYDVKEPVMAT
jgi:hypothetical protein